MRERLKLASPYISLFGLFLLAASPVVARWVRAQESTAVPPQLAWGLAIVGALLALAWPVLSTEELMALLGARRARFGTSALVLVISVLAILAAINFLGTRRFRIWDLTANKQYSVSRQTVQILENLTEPVVITTLTSPAGPPEIIEDLDRLIENYRQVQPGMVTFERIMPQFEPARYQALNQRLGGNVPGQGIVAESGGRHGIAYAFDEQALTEAVLRATRAVTKTVYFTTGHDEMPIETDTEDRLSYGAIAIGLRREGYEVETLTITGTLPVNADAIVVAGPQRPFLPEEAEQLATYVEGGGSVMLLLDPMLDHGLDAVLLPWDIRVQNDLVLDLQRTFPQPPWMVTPSDALQFHTITRALEGVNTLFPASRSITVGTPITTALQTTALVETSSSAWGETDLAALQQPGAQPAFGPDDNKGPLSLGAAGDGGEDYGRLVVWGTGGLASDMVLQQFRGWANGDLFLNSVNWLTQEEELISIRPTPPDDRPLNPPENPMFLLLATTLLLPAVVLGIGGWVHWQRR